MLTKKLQLKPGMRFAVVNAPAGLARTLGKPSRAPLDLVLLFAMSMKELTRQWQDALMSLKPDGSLWVAYPKKSSGIDSDLSMGEWDVTKGSGWNPVAMIGIDDTWSAVRFKHAPGLETARHERQTETINDEDGSVCVDRVKRIVTAPTDLQKLFAKSAKARAAFDALSFTNRKEYVVWILDAKKPETRVARLSKTVEMLSKGKKNPSDN
jgi:hypothetical protein